MQTKTDLAWTVWDKFLQKPLELSHEQFKDGLEHNYIELRSGYFILGSRNIKIWIDGVIK